MPTKTIATILILCGSTAWGNCLPRTALVDNLLRSHSEVPVTIAISGYRMIETFANDETGSWTLVGTDANNVSCILMAGQAFDMTRHTHPEPPPDDPF